MKNHLIHGALVCIVFLYCISNANAQVLIINNGSTLTINDGILDVNCLEILVKTGGALYLETGTLKNKDVLTLEPGSDYHNTTGTVINCGGNSFYLIHNPNGRPAVITLPKY